MDRQRADVVLIGSQVVYGFVGTTASAAIYRDAGMRACVAPTIVLSSVPHYDSVHAQPLDPQWLGDALADITTLGVTDEISTIHTGYFATPEQVEHTKTWITAALKQRPDLRVVVDPTLGDTDVGMYTDPAVAPALAHHILPLATGITPNAFELKMLTDYLDVSSADEVSVQSVLGDRGQWLVTTGDKSTSGEIRNRVLTRNGAFETLSREVDSSAKGTGDVFTAALVVALHRGSTIERAVRFAGDTVHERLRSSANQLAAAQYPPR
jgi:pyridoxine kinase